MSVLLCLWNGNSIYVNPAHVAYVLDKGEEGRCEIVFPVFKAALGIKEGMHKLEVQGTAHEVAKALFG